MGLIQKYKELNYSLFKKSSYAGYKQGKKLKNFLEKIDMGNIFNFIFDIIGLSYLTISQILLWDAKYLNIGQKVMLFAFCLHIAIRLFSLSWNTLCDWLAR